MATTSRQTLPSLGLPLLRKSLEQSFSKIPLAWPLIIILSLTLDQGGLWLFRNAAVIEWRWQLPILLSQPLSLVISKWTSDGMKILKLWVAIATLGLPLSTKGNHQWVLFKLHISIIQFKWIDKTGKQRLNKAWTRTRSKNATKPLQYKNLICWSRADGHDGYPPCLY